MYLSFPISKYIKKKEPKPSLSFVNKNIREKKMGIHKYFQGSYVLIT